MSANSLKIILASLLLVTILGSTAIAQEQGTGFPRFSSIESSGFDAVNRQNLNAHFEVPIASFPGRGVPFSYALVYDSLVWTKSGSAWVPVVNGVGTPTWGWKLDVPYGQAKKTSFTQQCDMPPPIESTTHYTNYRYQDASGTIHNFNIDFYQHATFCQFNTGPRTGYATDGSGIYMDATSPNAPKVTLPNGFVVTLVKDSNGNFVSLGANGTWTDTRGKAVLQITDGASTKTYAVLDKNGNYQNTVVNFQSFNIRTQFLCTGVSDYGVLANIAVSLPVSISLPNGQSYAFTYEDTPGHSGYKTGRLKRITLPTGGYYEYVYPTTGNNGTSCADGTPLVLTRYISDGTNVAQWDFSRSGTTTTITKPQLPYDSARNQSTYTFDATRSEKHYQGSVASGTLLHTLNTTFAGPIVSTVILPDGHQSKTETTLGPGDQVAQKTEYQFGAGAPGAAIRTTVNTFVTDTNYTNTNRNIGTLIASTVVREGSVTGPVKFRQNFAYDTTSITCVTGASQHDDTSYGCGFTYRGNPTAITTYADAAAQTGATTKTLYYDSLGNVIKTEVNGVRQEQPSYSSTTQYSQPDSVTVGPTTGPTLTSSFTYNANTGALLSSTDPNSKVTTFDYDVYGRPTRTDFPDGGNQEWGYATTDATLTIKLNASNYRHERINWDGLGRTTSTVSTNTGWSVVSATAIQYDPQGRAYRTSNPYTSSPQYWTENRFDALGRLLKTVLPDGNFTYNEYASRSSATYDEQGKQRVSLNDALGRTVQVSEPHETTGVTTYWTTYAYDVLDNLTQIVQNGDPAQGAQRIRTFTYDSLSQLKSSAAPESGTTTYTYDTFGRLGTKTDARGIQITYTYDGLNRITGKSYSDGSPAAIFSYDSVAGWGLNNALGRLVRTVTTGGANDTFFSYDSMGRLEHQWTNRASNNGTGWYETHATYNLAGALSTLTYPSGRKISLGYDAGGRLQAATLTAFGGATLNYPYYTANQFGADESPAVWTLGNGTLEALNFNSRLQPSSYGLELPTAGGTLSWANRNFGYGTANNGRIASISDSLNGNRTQSFVYDKLNRLKTAEEGPSTYSAGFGQNFTYDPWGNLKAQTSFKGTLPSPSFTVTDQNRLAGNVYDAAGNVTNDTIHTYTYNAEGLMATMDSGAAAYAYDAAGLRVRKQVGSEYTEYIYSGNDVISERTEAGLWKDYILVEGRVVAKSDDFIYEAHIHGRKCNSCGSQWAQFAFGSGANQAGYVVKNGDKLVFRQWQATGTRGGMTIAFTDSTNTNWTTLDQDGQPLNDDSYQNTIHWRRADLSPHAGKTISSTMLVVDTNTAAGLWDATYSDIAIVSADGSVRPVYTREASANLSNASISAGMTEIWKGVDLLTGRGAMPEMTTSYYHSDHLGSAKLVTTHGGWPITANTYTPFGYQTQGSSATNPYGFTFMEKDPESDLNRTLFRQFSQRMGRWMSADPYDGSMDLSNPQSMNRYGYVNNDPINWDDPLGLQGRSRIQPRYRVMFGSWNCRVDGMDTPCSIAVQSINLGAATVCPYSDCSRVRYTDEGFERWKTIVQSQWNPCKETHGAPFCGRLDTIHRMQWEKVSSPGNAWDVCGTICNIFVNPTAANFAAGAGDMYSFGITAFANKQTGADSVINRSSGAYLAGAAYAVGTSGAVAGAGMATVRGGELTLAASRGGTVVFRANPIGNWKNGQTLAQRLPHFHYRHSGPRGGIGWHRPWEGWSKQFTWF